MMESILFCDIQASDKTTFFKDNFYKTHVRISLDLFNTRRKETIFTDTCLANQQRFVIDNTNPTKHERQGYIEKAKKHKFKTICYYFITTVGEAITRNKIRTGKEFVPPAGIGGTFKRLQPPEYSEGFDEVFIVKIQDGHFKVELVEHPADPFKNT